MIRAPDKNVKVTEKVVAGSLAAFGSVHSRMRNLSIFVVVPCCNNASQIRFAIESVLRQTLQPLEILVADDESTDRSLGVVSEFDPPVRLIHQQHSGRAATMTEGIMEAEGNVISVLDADTVVEMGRF